jgi:hypothetical protein
MLASLFLVMLRASVAFASSSPSHSSQSPLNLADLRGFDVSQPQAGLNPNFWSCAFNAGYRKVVIRAYQQACGHGGRVDPNFVPAYNAAVAAGFTRIDAYMFPCVGPQPTDVDCKSPSEQVQELIDTINKHSLNIQRLWFDIEPTNGVCNAWQLGNARNLQVAREWIVLLRGTARDWGVYANRNQWEGMFGSLGADIASDLPLWAVQDDKVPGVSTVTKFFGGWKSAHAKQYWLDTRTPECDGSVDLDSFID